MRPKVTKPCEDYPESLAHPIASGAAEGTVKQTSMTLTPNPEWLLIEDPGLLHSPYPTSLRTMSCISHTGPISGA